jgi:hypothetical protein
MNVRHFALATLSLSAMLTSLASAQASFGLNGYTENFDGMLTGTARPTGWAHGFLTGGNTTFNATSTNAAIASTLGTGTLRNVPLATYTQTGSSLPAATQSSTSGTTYGYNAAFSSNSTNRIMGAAGATTVAASFIQLTLTNSTPANINSLSFAYDFVAIANGNSQGTSNNAFQTGNESELPGFRVFVSLNGNAGPWTNIPALNITPPANTPFGTVQNVTAANIALPSTWTPTSTLTIRWFKDNENLSSPDPLNGIDNISVVPTPSAAALLGLTSLVAASRRRSKH